MSKNKNKINRSYETPFYEIFGIFLIIYCVVVLGRLGKIGENIFILSKIIFGELMILIYILLSVVGFKCIIKKAFINLNTTVLYGIFFIFIGIFSINHLSIYNGLLLNSNNIIKKSYELYKYYYNHYDTSLIFGGGIFGALFLQIFMILFGYIGSIIISISLIICGLIFVTNNRISVIWTFFLKIKFIIMKCFNKIISFFWYFKTERKISKDINISLSILQDVKPTINSSISDNIAREYAFNIKKTIMNKRILAIILGIYVGYSSTTIKIESKDDIKEIFELFDNYFVIKEQKIYYIEVKNKFRELLTIKKCLIELNDEPYLLPIGMNNLSDILCINMKSKKYYLLSGEIKTGIRTYLKSLFASIVIKFHSNFKLYIIDLKNEMKEYNVYQNNIKYINSLLDSISILDELCNLIDRRKEILKYLNVSNYIDAQNINTEYDLKHLFLFVNMNIKKSNNEFITKFDYILKFGAQIGLHIFVVIRNTEELWDIPLNLANKICFHSDDLELSIKMLGSSLMQKLDYYGDIIYQRDTYITHGQTPFISDGDFNQIMKKISHV